jgi:hypothetical protein
MARNRAFERPETIAGREASKVFQSFDQKKGMTEYSLVQKAFHDNRERLKAERLAREAVVASRESRKTDDSARVGPLDSNATSPAKRDRARRTQVFPAAQG